MVHKVFPYVLLVGLCAVLFFVGLGSTPLIGLDEALYAEASREMVESGNYIVPTYNGQPFFDKPPFGYWLQAASIKAFGVCSFAVRLPSAIAAAMLVFLTVCMGTRLYSERAGLLAGFALATAIYTIPLARLCSLDQLFTLSITAALAGFLLAYLGIVHKWGYVLLWTAAGVSLLVKGPAGAVIVLAVIAVYLLVRRVSRLPVRAAGNDSTRRISGSLPHILGFVLLVLIAAPWYVLVQRETGGAFLKEFVLHQNLQRAMGADFHHNMPLWFYLPVYAAGFFPWSVFVPGAWIAHVRLRPKNRAEEASLFAAVWIAVVIGVFSLSRSKLPNYIYPAYPPSALLVGLLWSSGRVHRAAGAAFAVALIFGAALILGPMFLREPIPGLSTALAFMASALVLGAAVSAAMARAGRRNAAFAALCCGTVGFTLSAALIGLPIAARTMADPAVRLGREIRKITSPIDSVIAYSLSPRLPSLPFYAHRPVIPKHKPQELRPALEAAGKCLVIVQEKDRAVLPSGGRIRGRVANYILWESRDQTREGPDPGNRSRG